MEKKKHKKNISSKMDYDEYYQQCYNNHQKKYEEWYNSNLSRGVSISTIKKEIIKKYITIHKSIFGIWIDELNIKRYSDPFMAKMLMEFDHLYKFKTPKLITKLFEKRKEIEEETKRIRYYGDNEPINQSNKQIIDFIAKYSFYRDIIKKFDSEKTFKEWQEKNSDELNLVIYLDSIKNFQKIEYKLFEKKYIDFEGNWKESKFSLVGFLLWLKEKEFIIKNIKYINIRKIFEKRYNIDISQQFEKKRREKLIRAYIDQYNHMLSEFIEKKDM